MNQPSRNHQFNDIINIYKHRQILLLTTRIQLANGKFHIFHPEMIVISVVLPAQTSLDTHELL